MKVVYYRGCMKENGANSTSIYTSNILVSLWLFESLKLEFSSLKLVWNFNEHCNGEIRNFSVSIYWWFALARNMCLDWSHYIWHVTGLHWSALSQNQIEKQKIKVLKRKHCRAHGALACNDYIPPDTWNCGDTMRTSLLTIENLISVQV